MKYYSATKKQWCAVNATTLKDCSSRKKPHAKEHILYVPYISNAESADPYRLMAARGVGRGWLPMGRVLYGGDRNIWGLDSGEGCTMLSVC
jgi:hypothetical protein